jgi:hypothetical protein
MRSVKVAGVARQRASLDGMGNRLHTVSSP